jgi:hypothetical protein
MHNAAHCNAAATPLQRQRKKTPTMAQNGPHSGRRDARLLRLRV